MIVHVREAVRSDAGTILKFIQGLAEYEKAPEQVQATKESIVHSIFEKKFAHALIAECEDSAIKLRPIGFAVYYYAYSTWTSRPTLFLEDLFVLPEYRNLGVGKRLFKQLGDIAHKEDCARVEWNVLTWNAPSIAFYTKVLHASPLDEWQGMRLEGNGIQHLRNLCAAEAGRGATC